jgi:Colicin E5 ribonuclease domain
LSFIGSLTGPITSLYNAASCLADTGGCLGSRHALADAGVSALNTASGFATNGQGYTSPLPYGGHPDAAAFGRFLVSLFGVAIPGGEEDVAGAATSDSTFAGGSAAASASTGLGEAALKISPKIARQMEARGWTTAQIREAMASGRRVSAVNRSTGNAATRYINPTSGQSVVVDNVTGDMVHVGGPGFKYGTGSGDTK